MILITPEETSSPLKENIERLQTNLRGFARDIENLQERTQSGDVTDAETRKVFSDLRSWLRMAMETEKALARFATRNDEAACFEVLTQAYIADEYRKNFFGPILDLGWVRFLRPCFICRHPWRD